MIELKIKHLLVIDVILMTTCKRSTTSVHNLSLRYLVHCVHVHIIVIHTHFKRKVVFFFIFPLNKINILKRMKIWPSHSLLDHNNRSGYSNILGTEKKILERSCFHLHKPYCELDSYFRFGTSF